MEFTDRERRILADLERQLTGEQSGAVSPAVEQPSAYPAREPRPPMKPAARAAGFIGLLLILVGIPLGVGSSVLFGLLLVCWWLSPWLRRSLKKAGSYVVEAAGDGSRGTSRGGCDQ